MADLLAFSQEHQTAHQFVKDTLRRAILSGALAGGARLVQADIAAQLRVSTTPVREALRDLAAEGLIVFDPHRGAVVHELDMDELFEIYEIRKALEPLVIRRAVERISEVQLATAEELQDKMDIENDVGAWTDLNGRFHSLLEHAAGSTRMQSIVKSMTDTAAIYVAHSLKIEPERIEAGNREHRTLLDAMRRRDADAAAQVLVQHLEATLSATVGSRSSEGDVESSRQ